MNAFVPSPFAGFKTCVFRRYLTFRQQVVSSPAPEALEAARRARKQRKKLAKDERLRNFFGWCAGCEAYGSIF
ncbi:hypothetical protein [Hymenobacter swuensis]|uniref:Uncharacterized protein n=1 Tax=Hymenobacter swuensis DY53 TaxID=1227739 RepID=W8F7E2_9BACT|nr:hypothetical protein [Hymenobacter swuensis]AHJ98526.1 hypothetical protein Hsw_2931 [Hymenobacter swuensis DY53]